MSKQQKGMVITMNRNLIRIIFIGVLFFAIMCTFVYINFFVPNHSSGEELMDYNLKVSIFYTPLLAFVSGFVVGIFLKYNECKIFITLFFVISISTTFIFRCLNYPITISEFPYILFAGVVYTLVLTLLHGLSLMIAQGIIRIFKRIIQLIS